MITGATAGCVQKNAAHIKMYLMHKMLIKNISKDNHQEYKSIRNVQEGQYGNKKYFI